MRECCETCKFWNSSPRNDSPNECRRYPPRPQTPHLPLTGKSQWCGEWKAREK